MASATKCRVSVIRIKGKGTRHMLKCPHKRPRFISKSEAKRYGRR